MVYELSFFVFTFELILFFNQVKLIIMKANIKAMSFLVLSLISLFFISSCGDDDKEKQEEQEIIGNLNVRGVIFTERTIKAGNTLRAIVGTPSGEGEVVGTSTVEGKKFSLSLSTPTHLYGDFFGEVPEGVTISNPDVKTAVFSALELLGGGSMMPDDEDILMCSDQAPKWNSETFEVTFSNMALYVYADANVTIKGEYVDTSMVNEEGSNVKVNVSLKKGWNIMLSKNNEENAEVMSLSDLPANYKWYLLGDVVSGVTNQSSRAFRKPTLTFPWLK